MRASHFRLALDYLRRHKALFVAVLFWRALWEIVPMQVPVLTGALVDGLTGKGLWIFGRHWHGATPHGAVRLAAVGLSAVALAYGVSAYAYTVLGARLDRRFLTDLRKALAEKLVLLSLDHHQRLGSGGLMDRMLKDVDQLRGFTERVFTRSLTNTVRAGYPMAMLVLIDARLALVALAVVPVQWGLTWRLQAWLHRAARRQQELQSDLTTAVKESLDGIETIQALNARGAAVERMCAGSDRVETGELHTSRIDALIRANIWFLSSVGLALTWWRGGVSVLDGTMTIGTLIAFTGFVEYAYRPFRHFSTIVKSYQVGAASLERIVELLELPPVIADRPEARALPVTRGAIRFRSVTFDYGRGPVLRDLDLHIQGGRCTAIVGPSGSGKSSLLRLIPRLYDPSQGEIAIDGRPLSAFRLDALRAQVAVVPQYPAMFSGTLLENLRLAKPDASLEEVEEACDATGALGFIGRLEGGFQARLGRGGCALSGGQLQRLAIARALLQRPRILLLDEPTSALDAESERLVVDALCRLRGSMTVVLVTHRLSTAAPADRVVLLEAGRVAADGPPEEVLARAEFGLDGRPVMAAARVRKRL